MITALDVGPSSWLLLSMSVFLMVYCYPHQSQRGFKETAGRGSMIISVPFRKLYLEVWNLMIAWDNGKAYCFPCNAVPPLDCIFLMKCFPSLNSWYLYKSMSWVNLRSPKVYFKWQRRTDCWHTDVHDTIWVKTAGDISHFFPVSSVILYTERIS